MRRVTALTLYCSRHARIEVSKQHSRQLVLGYFYLPQQPLVACLGFPAEKGVPHHTVLALARDASEDHQGKSLNICAKSCIHKGNVAVQLVVATHLRCLHEQILQVVALQLVSEFCCRIPRFEVF